MGKLKCFKVCDTYGGRCRCIGYADTFNEADQIYKKRMVDTEGDCKIIIKERQSDGGYKIKKRSPRLPQIVER